MNNPLRKSFPCFLPLVQYMNSHQSTIHYDYQNSDYLAQKKGTLSSFLHAWQHFDITNYSRFDERWWRIDRYKTRNFKEQELSDIIDSPTEIFPNPAISANTLAYLWTNAPFYSVLYTNFGDSYTHAAHIHEKNHYKHPNASERQIREMTQRETADYSQTAGFVGENYF